MPFPRNARTLAPLFLALAATAAYGIDTITLKDGEKLEGKITDETAEELTIEYKATPTISDTRTIKKADIEKMEKESPDEAAFQKLKDLKPGPSGYPVATYEQILAALQGFVDSYPQSTHKAAIAEQITAFTKEKERVETGEVKIGGKWLTKEDAEKERYQLSGQVLFDKMQDAAKRGDFVGALNTFDQIEKNYNGSYAFPDAVDYARQVVTRLKAKAETGLQTWKQRKAERDKGTQLASEPDKSQLIEAQKREQAQNDAALDAASKSRVKWIPFLPSSEKGLTTLASAAGNEERRLDTLPVQKMRESIQSSEKARGQVAEKLKGNVPEKDPAADASLKEALRLWPQNEVALRLQKQVLALASAPKATPAPTATAPGASPAASPTPAVAKAAPKPATPAPAPVPVEEPKNFFLTPVGGAVILALLIIVFAAMHAYRKFKEKPEESVP